MCEILVYVVTLQSTTFLYVSHWMCIKIILLQGWENDKNKYANFGEYEHSHT